MSNDGLLRMAWALSKASDKYFELFGVRPYGTVQQIAAMLELCPEAKTYISLYEKNRERSLTD